MFKVFISAGDPSGDLYSSYICQKLEQILPDIEIHSAGGEKLSQISKTFIDLTKTAVTGIFETITYLKRIISLFNKILKHIDDLKPDLIILVDFPDFNLRLAKKLKQKGYKIVYFISPQIWAWRKKRVKTIKKYIDKMLVIFKFEESIYKKENVPVSYIGHPLLEIISNQPKEKSLKQQLGIKPGQPLIILLPGSRTKEAQKHLPIMLQSKEIIAKEIPAKFALIKHPKLPLSLFSAAEKQNIPIIENKNYSCLQGADLAIASSGTITIELAILQIPSVIIYKLNISTWLILKNIVKVNYISMPNIILNQPVFPEFIQFNATAENVSAACIKLIEDKQFYRQTKEKLKTLLESLKPGNAISTAANEILAVAGKKSLFCNEE